MKESNFNSTGKWGKFTSDHIKFKKYIERDARDQIKMALKE